MVGVTKQDILDDYHGANSFSFGGKNHVKDKIKISDRNLDNVLSHSEIYTEFKQFKKPNPLPPIRTYAENYLWEADLMFFTHPDFVKENEGFLYILAIIDTFTKMVMVKLLKTKNTQTVTKDVEELFERDKPKYLRVDAGGEFVSNMFTSMCKRHNVEMYIAMEPIKCAMIERFNRSFKRILVQIMEYNNSIKWIKFVHQALEIYHNRYHRSIKMTPYEANMQINHDKVFKTNMKRYAKSNQIKAYKNKKPSKFTLGQLVKVFAKRNIFSRGFNQNVTKEYFQIYHIDRNLSKDRYYLKDLAGDKVLGSFYQEYLVPFSPPADGGEFKLDPDHKDFRRKKIRGIPHIFVKWKGWPKKFNQWVKESDIRRFI